MFTAEMFAPIVKGITDLVPIAIGVAASILAVTFVARKGFSIFKSFINKA